MFTFNTSSTSLVGAINEPGLPPVANGSDAAVHVFDILSFQEKAEGIPRTDAQYGAENRALSSTRCRMR